MLNKVVNFSGILMKDFTALHAALPDRVGDGLINVKKMMMIGSKFEVTISLLCANVIEP